MDSWPQPSVAERGHSQVFSILAPARPGSEDWHNLMEKSGLCIHGSREMGRLCFPMAGKRGYSIWDFKDS